MNDLAYYKLTALASAPDALDKAAEYLAPPFLCKRGYYTQ